MKTIKYRIIRCVRPGVRGMYDAVVWFEVKYKRLFGWGSLHTLYRQGEGAGEEWYRRNNQFNSHGEAMEACEAHAAMNHHVIKTIETEVDL